MWIREYSKTYHHVKKDVIWQLWKDVNNWPAWHGDLDYCKLEGDFKVGNAFMLKPNGAPAVKIDLLEIDEGRKFTDCTRFFGAKMYNTHTIEETAHGIRLSNKLVVTGWLQFLWIKLVAQKVVNTVPQELDSLVELARSKSA